MKIQRATIDARDAMRDVELTVHVLVRNLWRVRLGVALMRLGAWVAGVGAFVVDDSEAR
jgi:hypothetical protein